MGSLHTDILKYLQQQHDTYGPTTYAVRTTPVSGQHIIDVVDEAQTNIAVESTENNETVSTEVRSVSNTVWKDSTTIEQLESTICRCLECPLGTTRTNFVFGSGNNNADVMVVGEAPGAEEDAQGLPFVGRAGKLLTKILEAIDLPREEVYICNILKCRPPNNRKPTTAETDTCEPYLWKQIELVRPKYILALGLTAANTLLRSKRSMSDLRSEIHDYQGIPTIVTYHPAALLRNPNWKRDTWEDVKKLRSLLDSTQS